MIFKPAQLGMAKLDPQELEADKKACRKIGPCGVGKKALYLNSFYIDRRYYLPYGSITRVFKRVAMSSGGFSGKGVFASMAYLVVEYDGGKQKQCNFKDERDVDALLELLAKRLDEAGVSHFTLQGSTPKPVRAEQVRRFNQGEADVFLISLRAGGTGLNLTAADIVIHYDPWWNVAAQNQATDRAYRIGQQNPVQVYKLIAQDTIEEKIVALQQAKQSLAETVTGSADGAILSMKPEELLELLEVPEP